MKITTLPLCIHEACISRFIIKDVDDPALQALHDAVKTARECAAKAGATTEIVLRDITKTEAAKHRAARSASFDLLQRGTLLIDQAVKTARSEIEAIESRVRGPAPSRDPSTIARQADLRERLAQLPADRRMQIINSAATSGDELLLGAILRGYPWESNLTDSEIERVRYTYAAKHHASDVARKERLEKAIASATQAGSAAINFVDGLTNAELVAKGEVAEKEAALALIDAK
jgi:hypothetical protein